ncbi:MAG: Coq4 family protein [Myxococcota bacterium]
MLAHVFEREGILVRWSYALLWGAKSLWSRDFVSALAVVQDALDVQRFERLGRQVQADPWVANLRARGGDLLAVADELPRFRCSDPNTFGHQMALFYDGEATLKAEIPDTRWTMTELGRWAQLRWRYSHDLRHVLLGLGTTVHEEAILHTFQLAQYRTWMGLLLIVPALVLGTIEGGNVARTLRYMVRAWRAGQVADLVAFADLEWLLDQPIQEVRAILGIEPIGSAYLADGAWRPHRPTWPVEH